MGVILEKVRILEVKGITKTFGGVVALDNVDFEVYQGEIVALLGDNGAGKSTLIKVIAGVYTPDSGDINFENRRVEINAPVDSMMLGIETIYQDLALFDNLTASANVYMGREEVSSGIGKFFGWLNQKEMDKRTSNVLTNVGIELPNPRTIVKRFSGGQRQGIAIGRAVLWGKKLVIMDEPTAALGVRESAKLLALIKNLINIVKGIIIISHNIEHVIGVADRAVILRRGKRVGEMEINKSGDPIKLHNELVAMITGRVSNNV
jgi:ABC-type sugar transport system ATPase subunit